MLLLPHLTRTLQEEPAGGHQSDLSRKRKRLVGYGRKARCTLPALHMHDCCVAELLRLSCARVYCVYAADVSDAVLLLPACLYISLFYCLFLLRTFRLEK